MKSALLLILLTGCTLFAPDPNKPKPIRGLYGTWGFEVLVETKPPGAKIEVNGDTVGISPLKVMLFAEHDREVHHNLPYIIIAYPTAPGDFQQIIRFHRDSMFNRYIPTNIYFDMHMDKVLPIERFDIKNTSK
jgi:hypothetical protein